MVWHISAKSPQHVSYGDATCILCSELKGLVTSDPNVSNAVFLDEQESFRDRLVPHSVMSSIFSITPKCDYLADKAYKKRLQKVKDKGNKITEHNWRRKLDRSDPLYKDLAADQVHLAKEKETNKVEARRKEGTPLVFGATIQLQLTGTNKFVTQAKNRARLDKLAMQIELADGGSDGSWWVVTDKEGIRQEGDFVGYCDKMCLKNAKFQQSHFCVSSDSISSVLHTSIQTRYEVNAAANMYQLEFFPFASWTNSRVRLERGQDNQGDDREASTIRGGDTVTFCRKSPDGVRFLYHKQDSETATWGLESEVSYPWDLGNVTFEEVQAADVSQLKTKRLLPGQRSPAVFRVCLAMSVPDGAESAARSMWRVKPRKLEMGGEALAGGTSAVLVLQNVGTGLYLATNDAGEVRMSNELHAAECAWKIASRGGQAGSQTVSSGQPIWVVFDGLVAGSREDGQRWLSLSYHDAVDNVLPGQIEAAIGAAVRTGARRRAVVGVEFGDAPTDRDVVEIKLVESKEADKVDYMRRCRETLACIHYRLSRHAPMEPALAEDEAKAVFRRHPVRDVIARELKTLTVMLTTIANSSTISSDEDPLTRDGPPNVEQQNLIREMGFIESVMELLTLFSADLHLPLKLFKAHFRTEWYLCRLGYTLIEKACTANRISKTRMQQHVSFMLSHIAYELGSYFAYMAIFSGNRELLVNLSEADVVRHASAMEHTWSDRVVNFVLEPTHFQADPIKANQELIARLIFQDRQHLLFYVQVTENDVWFHEYGNSGTDLKTLSIRDIIAEADDDLESVDEGLTSVELPKSVKLQRLRYYLQLIKLMARVAHGSDPEVKEVVLRAMTQCHLEPEHISKVVSLEWLPFTVRSYCLTLYSHVLVVGDPSSRQAMTMATRVWSPTRVKVEKEEQREAQQLRTTDANALARELLEGWTCPPEIADTLRQMLLVLLKQESATDVDVMGKNVFARVLLDAMYELVSFGHLHMQDLESSDRVPDFEKMRAAADVLIPLLDGRADKCAAFGGWDGDVARFHLNERTQVVMETKLRALEVLGLFFACAQEERWTRFMRSWTKYINAHFSIASWDDVMQTLHAGKHDGNAEPVPHKTPSGRGIPTLRATFSRMAKVAPQVQLTDFSTGKKSWDTHAPWTQDELKDLETLLFADPPIISKMFSVGEMSDMFTRGSGTRMPEWISLLLDLIQYDSNRLKEKALVFLIATFNSKANFIVKLKSTLVITMPEIAKIFFAVKREMGVLRNHIPLLSNADKTQREKGFLVVEHIMRQWTKTLTHTRPRGVTTGLQQVINDLGAADVAVRILFVPFKRVRAEGPGQFDSAVLLSGEPGGRLVELFTQLYRMLAAMCDGNVSIQNHLIKYCEWKEMHLGIEGLDMELLLESAVRDNSAIVARVGQSWINTIFGIMEQYKCRHAKLLSVLEPLIKCNGNMIKENQSLVSVRFQECEDVVAYFMTSDEDRKLRIDLMKQEPREDRRDLLSFHIGVIRLLVATSEGRSPSAEVYAARYLSFKDCCKMLVFLDSDSQGSKVEVLPLQLYRVRTEYMRFLLHVYTETGVESLLDELHEVGNGLWLFDDDPDCDCRTYEPLMRVCEMEIRSFTDAAGRNEEKDRPGVLALQQYLFSAVFPFLTQYFATHYIKAKGQTYGNDGEQAAAIFAAVEALVEQGLPPELELVYVARGPVSEEIDCLKLAADLLKAMSQKARVREDWAQRDRVRPRERKRVETEAEREVECWMVIQKSYESLYGSLSKFIGISDTHRMISTGVLRLAMLVSRRGEVPIFNNINFLEDLGRSTPNNPSYDDFVFAILAISREGDRISAALLTDILRVLRAAIYTFEPTDPGRTFEEVGRDWERFLGYEPVQKVSDESLDWVQNRFDALGCTTAALRLMGSLNTAVQFNSALLLMTLLQGGNPRVQRTVLNHLRGGRDVGWFLMAKNAIERGGAMMGEFRKTMKRHKVAFANGLEVASLCRQDARLESGMQLDSFGRGSLLMVTLQLLQLLCKRHFRPLQSMLLSQAPALVSHNLIRACIALLAAAGPVLEASLEYNIGDVAILCMQILDTLAEAAQGPNTAVGDEVVKSGLLAQLCSVLQCTGYVSLALGRKKASGLGSSVNDIKVWLRRAALRCVLAVLEGVQTEAACEEVRKYLDLRILCSQLVQTGRLIGKVRPADMSDEDMAMAAVDDTDAGFANNASVRFGASMMGGRAGSIMGGSGLGGSMMELGGGSSDWLPPPTEMGFGKGWEEGLADEVFKIYFILLHLQEFDGGGEVGSKVSITLKAHNKLRVFLTSCTSHVELLRRITPSAPPIVVKVFFRLDERVQHLTEGKDFRMRTEAALFDVPRNNPQEKADAFFTKLRFAVDRITWLLDVSKSPVLRFFIRFRNIFDKTPIIISMLITLLLLFCYGIPVDPNTGRPLAEGRFFTRGDAPAGYEALDYPFAHLTSDPTGIGASYGTVVHQSDLALQYRVKLTSRWNSDKEWELFPEGKVVIYFLSALHVFVSISNAAVYLIQDLPLVILTTLDQYFLQTLGRLPWIPQVDQEEDEDEPITLMVGIQRRKKRLTGRAYLRSMPDPAELQQHIWASNMDLYWRLLRANKTTFYIALNLVISILGLTSSPFFFVLQLLDYFRMRDGRLVLRSISVGGPNLFRSFVLGVIVIVCFGFMTYTYFSPTVNADQEQCHSPWQCVTKHILDSMTGDLTTVLGTDLGVWAFSAIVPWEDLWKTWRTLFVFVSLIFWVFLLQGIIQGQIIDAFAEMRTESNKAREDLEQKCFVSSLERYAFADFPGEWEKRRGGKFAWNYLHYASYLNTSNPDEFDGNERAVFSAYCRLSSDFLPVGEFFAARRAESVDEMAKDNVKNRLRTLEMAMNDRFRTLEMTFQKEMKKVQVQITASTGVNVGRGVPRSSRVGSDISVEDVLGLPGARSSSVEVSPTHALPQPPDSSRPPSATQ